MRVSLTILCAFGCALFAKAQVETVKTFKWENDFRGVKLLNNGKMIFAAQDDNKKGQVWVSDGTTQGTQPLTNLCSDGSGLGSPFAPYNNSYQGHGVYSDGDNYYSIVNENCSGSAILRVFKTDGSDISFSSQSNKDFSGLSVQTDWSNFYDSVSVGDKIYFFSGSKGIWMLDKSTNTVSNVYGPGNPFGKSNNDVRFLGKDGDDLILFFHNPYVLVRFNTSNNEVTPFYDAKQFYVSKLGYNNVSPSYDFLNDQYSNYTPPVYNYNGEIYFFMYYFNTNDSKGYYALWKTDGTEAGTSELKTFNSNAHTDRGVFFTPFNDKLYFRFSDKTKSGLWVTDGTSNGTTIVKAMNSDTNYHSEDGVMSNIVTMNGKMYFLGTDNKSNDFELWESDGTAGGTKKSFEFLPDYMGYTDGNSLFNFIYNFNNRLYFIGKLFNGAKSEIISSDGTLAGTYSLGGMFAKTSSPLIYNDGYIYFASGYYNGSYLMRVNISNPKAYLLNKPTGNASKGQSFTVTGFDLKGAKRAYLYNETEYAYADPVAQINDTAVSFTIPDYIKFDRFKVAVETEKGTLISSQEISIGGTSIAEKNAASVYAMIQTNDKVILNFQDMTKKHQVKLLDVSGKILYTSNIENGKHFTLNKNDLKAGIYLLQIDNNFSEKVYIW